MKKDLVTYNQAKALKELGFVQKTNFWYEIDNPSSPYFSNGDYENHNIRSPKIFSAPTLYEAIEWLYSNHKIWVGVDFGSYVHGVFFDWTLCIQDDYNNVDFYTSAEWNGSESYFSTPNECMSAGLDVAIEFIEQEKE